MNDTRSEKEKEKNTFFFLLLSTNVALNIRSESRVSETLPSASATTEQGSGVASTILALTSSKRIENTVRKSKFPFCATNYFICIQAKSKIKITMTFL